MRRALLLAAILLLPLLAVACGTQHRQQEEKQAVEDLSAAAPSLMAYWADHNSYAGATTTALRKAYDPTIAEISIVRAKENSVCVEAVSGSSHAFMSLPDGEIMIGSCSDQTSAKPYEPPASTDSSSTQNPEYALHASVPAIEAYYMDHDGYTGMTLPKLREIDYGVPTDLKIVSAKKQTYCVEIAGEDESFFKQGPAGEIETGTCPN